MNIDLFSLKELILLFRNELIQRVLWEQGMSPISSTQDPFTAMGENGSSLTRQVLALQDSGMKCLRHANLPVQAFYHLEKFINLANKLLNTANQTIQTVLKYCAKGQQTMQVVHVHEGQTIVTQNLSSSMTEGAIKKT